MSKKRVGITGSDGIVGTKLSSAFANQYDLRRYTLNTVDYE